MTRFPRTVRNIGTRIKASVSGTDADVQAFLDATGITDQTIIDALNDFIGTLKGSSLYTGKWITMYPIVGGNADDHKFNFVNPVDTDGGFRLSYLGTGIFTHDANGIRGNGVNTVGLYCSTHVNALNDVPSSTSAVFWYVNADADDVTEKGIDFGCLNGSKRYWGAGDEGSPTALAYNALNTTTSLNVSATGQTGNFSAKRDGTAAILRKNGSDLINTTSALNTMPDEDIYFVARNIGGGTPEAQSSKTFCFFGIMNEAPTSGEVTIIENAIEQLQVDLSREN